MPSRQRRYARYRKRWREAHGVPETAGRSIGVPVVCDSRPSAATLLAQGYREVKGWRAPKLVYHKIIDALCSEWGRT